MAESEKNQPRRFASVQYGSLTFENVNIPCAFGGQPGRFTAFILIEGICNGIGINSEIEIKRIQNEELLVDGLYMVPFKYKDEQGREAVADFPTITLSRFHTWLSLIPSDLAPSEEMRAKLRAMKTELVDVLYGYFGRPLLPADMQAEEETYLSEADRLFYARLAEASQLPGKINDIHEEVEEVHGEVKNLRDQVLRLSVRMRELEGEDTIDAAQQQMLKSMMGVLCARYMEKHGPDTYDVIAKELTTQYNFRHYRASKKDWPALVQDCIQRHRTLFGRSTPLPRVFQHALEDISQDRLI
jgi:hypothetical protein